MRGDPASGGAEPVSVKRPCPCPHCLPASLTLVTAWRCGEPRASGTEVTWEYLVAFPNHGALERKPRGGKGQWGAEAAARGP